MITYQKNQETNQELDLKSLVYFDILFILKLEETFLDNTWESYYIPINYRNLIIALEKKISL